MLSTLQAALYLLYLFLLCRIVLRSALFKDEHISPKVLTFFFLLKVAAGIGLTLLYTYYYTDPSKSDIYRYFNDSKVISNLLLTNPAAWFSAMTGFGLDDPEVFQHLMPTQYFSHPTGDLATQNSFIIRLISVFNFFSFSNIYVNTLFFSFLSFTGCYWLYRFYSRFTQSSPLLLVLPFFLLPSLLFWSSGLLKESLVFFALGLFLLRTKQPLTYLDVLLKVISLLLLFSIKTFIGLFLLLANALLVLSGMRNRKYRMAASIIAGLLFIACAVIALEKGYCEVLIEKRMEFTQLAQQEQAGSLISDEAPPTDCIGLMQNAPSAVFNAIAQPINGTSRSAFHLLFALENLALLALFALLLFHIKRPSSAVLFIVAFCFVFAFANYLLIGWTVPVVGAIVHYRVVATPFLLTGFILLSDLDLNIYIKNLKIWLKK